MERVFVNPPTKSAKTVIFRFNNNTTIMTARYMGISKSYLYKSTMRQQIPHYKPMGKMCYFNRAELEEWLQTNRCATDTELKDRANRMIMKGGVRL